MSTPHLLARTFAVKDFTHHVRPVDAPPHQERSSIEVEKVYVFISGNSNMIDWLIDWLILLFYCFFPLQISSHTWRCDILSGGEGPKI